MVDSSPPPVIFNDISTNSGLAAGELFPVVHVKSKLLVVVTHALYYAPTLSQEIWIRLHSRIFRQNRRDEIDSEKTVEFNRRQFW
jgi:hypothetical protein